MTVVLALRCADGFVLATDSQGTAQMPGGIPVRMDTPKIDQAGDWLLFAGTGSQGLGQRVKASLDNHITKLNKKFPRAKIGAEIHGLVSPFQKASEAAYISIPGTSMESWGGIFCGLAADGPYLMEIDLHGAWQFHDQPPFASTGSGHAFAHLAISSVLHYDVVTKPLDTAKLLAYRAIENVCLASAWGVSLPVQMGVLTKSGSALLSSEEIEELKETVNLWKTREVETLGELAPQPSQESASVATDEGLAPPE